VGKKEVNSDELKAMNISGIPYKRGLRMTQQGQSAEVFCGCSLTFRDCPSTGDVVGETLSANSSLPFTFFPKKS
jgi:hypothetical protein